MSESERIITHFNENARRCIKHGKRFVLAWDGIWSITCKHDGSPEFPACAIHDADNSSATPIQTLYLQSPI